MPNPNRQARYPRDLVKLLNENIDLDALVFDTDASGNPIIVDSKSGDTIAYYDRDTGEWNLSSLNIESLSTDSATIGGTPENRPVEQIAQVTQSAQQLNVTQSIPSDYEDGRVIVDIDILSNEQTGTNPTLNATIDGVTDYNYQTESTAGLSKTTFASEIPIVTMFESFDAFFGTYTMKRLGNVTVNGNGTVRRPDLFGDPVMVSASLNSPSLIDDISLTTDAAISEAEITFWGSE